MRSKDTSPARVPSEVWVVNWRLELERDSNQTEFVSPHVFTTREEAVEFAKFTLGFVSKKWDAEASATDKAELVETISKEHRGGVSMPYAYCLTSSDNLVVELAKCKLNDNKEVRL